MIKYHPNAELLDQFVSGELPASLSAAISIHLDHCPHCQAKVDELTDEAAKQCFGIKPQIEPAFSEMGDFAQMLAAITDDETQDEPAPVASLQIEVKDQLFNLPKQLNNMNISNFSGFGKISRAKIELGEGETHSHLLYMAPKGEVPKHTHNGFELTLLLEGDFHDDFDTYHPGDFIMLDGKHLHQPRSENGCLCMTVVSDALQFTEGLSRLLNPVGKYIY